MSDSPSPLAKYRIQTFGCQMNYADSEKVDMALFQSWLRKTVELAEADVVIVNTCSVRQRGEDRVFGYVREVKALARRLGRNVLIGVTGCMVRKTGIARRHLPEGTGRSSPKGKISLMDENSAGASAFNWDDDLFSRSEHVDFVFRIEEVGRLSKILSSITGDEVGNDEKWESYLRMRQSRENPFQANVIIQTGCDNFCTFCIVPHTRGREWSRPVSEIVDEVERAVAEGAKEVTLLGQNVNSYWKTSRASLWNAESLKWNTDASGSVEGHRTPFRELLEAVSEIDGLERMRFTSSNPHDMTKDILDAHFELPAMTPYLHVALQSGSDRILRAMNRKHAFADFKAQVDYLRSKDPYFAISTDLIVGFPGETEEDFQATLAAMESCDFDFAYIARYSPRNGTFATDRLGDDVSAATKADRWNRANSLLESIAKRRCEGMLGRTEEILITGKGRTGGFVGRTRNFKEAFLSETSRVKIGQTVPVRISGTEGWSLIAEVA